MHVIDSYTTGACPFAGYKYDQKDDCDKPLSSANDAWLAVQRVQSAAHKLVAAVNSAASAATMTSLVTPCTRHQLTPVASVVARVMSKSFLVESLLTTDDIKDACSSSSRNSQYVTDIVSNAAVKRPLNRNCDEGATHRTRLPNGASSHVQACSQMPPQLFDHRQPLYQTLMSHDSRTTALLTYWLHHQPPPQVAVADAYAYVQVQSLAAALRRPTSERRGGGMAAMSAGCSADTHQRRRHVGNNEPQPLKLAAAGHSEYHQQLADCNSQYKEHHHRHQRRRQQLSKADLRHNCLTSMSTPSSSSSSSSSSSAAAASLPATDDRRSCSKFPGLTCQ